jgi:hypothetical protein
MTGLRPTEACQSISIIKQGGQGYVNHELERFAIAYDVAYAEGGDKIRVKPIEDEDNSSNTRSGQEEGQVKGTDANEGSEGSKETADASGIKSRENGAAEPVYNASREELNKDNGFIPCAFCEHSFPDEEAISHMIAVHPRMSG